MNDPITRSTRRLLRTDGVADKLGCHRVSVWRWAKGGLLPRPIIIGKNTPAWFEDEIDAFLASRATDAVEEVAR